MGRDLWRLRGQFDEQELCVEGAVSEEVQEGGSKGVRSVGEAKLLKEQGRHLMVQLVGSEG